MTSREQFRALAAEVNLAHATLNEVAQRTRYPPVPNDPNRPTHLAAATHFREVLDRALPASFFENLETLRKGGAGDVETPLAFLEADPWFHRSGYAKADALKSLKRVALKPAQERRLKVVILEACMARDRREFRQYCNLAPRLADPTFRLEVERLVRHADPDVRRRAGWLMAALRR